jgi:hypothetical protein
MKDNKSDGIQWPADCYIPTFQPVQHLSVYDLRGASRDTLMTATILAGLVNRPQPRLYLVLNDDDAFWLHQSFVSIPQTQAQQHGEDAFNALLQSYHEVIQGLIVYDPALLDTINVATTMAGPHNALVVAPSAVPLLQDHFGLSVLVDLRTYAWKNRAQAYRWAWQHLRPTACTHIIAGLDPGSFCGLRSFLVATNSFVYWLDSRPHPIDFCWWLLTERGLLKRLCQSLDEHSVHLGWFIHEPSGVALTSQSSIVVIASDYFTNLEVWTAFHPPVPSSPTIDASQTEPHKTPDLLTVHFPQSTQAAQEPSNNVTVHQSNDTSSRQKIYLSFTMSDGDNLQFCQHRLLHLWQDPVRGSIPIGWTLTPVLLQAAPALAHYYLSTASRNDELIAGPSGVGYLFPSNWPTQHLENLLQRTGVLMQSMGMTTIEILDTDVLYRAGLPFVSRVSLRGMTFTSRSKQQLFAQQLLPYGVQGILSGAGFWFHNPHWEVVSGIPLYHNLGLADTVDRALWLIKRATTALPQRPLYLNLYVIAWSMGPTQLKQVVERLGPDYEIVLPRQLLAKLITPR